MKTCSAKEGEKRDDSSRRQRPERKKKRKNKFDCFRKNGKIKLGTARNQEKAWGKKGSPNRGMDDLG